MSELDQNLNEVKGIYSDKFGHIFDQERAEEADVLATRGSPPSISVLE